MSLESLRKLEASWVSPEEGKRTAEWEDGEEAVAGGISGLDPMERKERRYLRNGTAEMGPIR